MRFQDGPVKGRKRQHDTCPTNLLEHTGLYALGNLRHLEAEAPLPLCDFGGSFHYSRGGQSRDGADVEDEEFLHQILVKITHNDDLIEDKGLK
jgi:hypothetical protein